MSDELPPFDDEIEALLCDERSALAPPPGARARVGSRLASTLGITLAIGGAAEVAGAALAGGDAGPDPLGGDVLGGGEALGGALPTPGADAAAGALSSSTDVVAHGADAALQAATMAGAKVATTAGAGAAATGAGAAGAGSAAATAGAGAAAAATTVGTATVATGAAATTGLVALLAKPLVIGAFVAGTMVGGGTVAVVQPRLAEPVQVRQAAPSLRAEQTKDSELVDAEAAPAVADDGFEMPVEAEPAPRASRPVRRAPRKRVAVAPPRVEEAQAIDTPAPEVEPLAPPVEKDAPAEEEVEPNAVEDTQAEPTLEVLPPDDGRRGRSQLAKEQALLEVARTALSRRKPVQALSALQEHGTRFPHASLSEEREVLFILALLGAGRDDEAKARASAFKKRFPRSMQLPIVDGALR
jgi:hypothetical protein